jgi:hypothetical protein
MKKKFFTGLAPLLVIAACAMAPGSALGSAEISWPACTAPSCPHIYRNGSIGPENSKIRGIAWGNLALHNERLGDVECRNIFAGFGINPTGGGRAEGSVQAFYPYECNDPTCAAAFGELKVTANNFAGEVTLPFKSEGVESPAGSFYLKSGFKGPSENQKANKITEPGQVEFNIDCTTITHPDFFGVSYFHALKTGLSIGAAPEESETHHESFDTLHYRNQESVGNAGGVGEVEKGKTGANLKGEGYAAEELLETKNP